jgi:hypothetical protein
MGWSYSGDPVNSDLDKVRFEIGDTDSTDQQLQDEEIEYTISAEPSLLAAAARCCEVLSRKFSRLADNRLGPQQVWASQRSVAYAERAKELRSKSSALGGLYVGGLDKNEELLDQDLRQPAFKRDLMSNKEV